MINKVFIDTDICNIEADAIVLPANESLKEGSGVSTALFQAAGRKELTRACEKIGHCDVGSAVVTDAFNLNAQFIIHACVPKWVDGDNDEYKLLCSAYIAALQMADLLNCITIAFPLLASGNNKFDKELALEIAVKCIESFEPKHLQQAVIVLYGENTVDLVKKSGYPVISVSAPNKQRMHATIKLQPSANTAEFQQAAMNWFKERKHQQAVLAAGVVVLNTVLKNKKGVVKTVDQVAHIITDAL